MTRGKRILTACMLATASAGLMTMGATLPAGAAVSGTSASWEMDEGPGATTMIDSSGNGAHGSIGSAIETGVWYDGAQAYRWAFASPTLPPAKPERIILVWDNSLNPGTGDYAVEVRYRTKQPFGNIVQKAQGGATGGYFKLENPKGFLTCVFRGVDGTGAWKRKRVASPTPLNDNLWHTVRCERIGKTLSLTVDGVVVRVAKGTSGNIWNDRPVSIGGKYNCDQIKTSCDYFTGDIDYIKIEQ